MVRSALIGFQAIQAQVEHIATYSYSCISRHILKSCNTALPLSHRIGNIFELMEILNNKLAEIPNLRVLSQRPETKADGYLAVDKLLNGDFANDKLFRTVSPALAFQYVSANER